MCVCQAEPVLADIEEVCQYVDQETPQEPTEEPTQVRENICFGCFFYQWGLFVFLDVCLVCFILFSLRLYLFCFQTSSLLLLDNSSAPPAEVGERLKQ